MDQDYEMKPMLGVRTNKLLDPEDSSCHEERLGNGNLSKFKSDSTDDTVSRERVGRFFNLTEFSDSESQNAAESAMTVQQDDEFIEDLHDESPRHKLISDAKSNCSNCTRGSQEGRCYENFEVRLREMSANMQKLESRMETLISLLETNGIGNMPAQTRKADDKRERDCVVTSVWSGEIAERIASRTVRKRK